MTHEGLPQGLGLLINILNNALGTPGYTGRSDQERMSSKQGKDGTLNHEQENIGP